MASKWMIGLVCGAAISTAAPAQDTENATAETLDPTPTGFFQGWTGSAEAGLSGASGNTERFNFRTGLNLSRETEEMVTTFGAVYSYANDDGSETENRARFNARNDWLLPDSPWRIFAQAGVEYDEFQDWDLRYTVFAGGGYEFIDNDTTTLLGRIGVGGSYEQGGQNEEFTPEGLLGLDLAHQLTERSKITATAEYYPSFDDLTEFRAIARASYEVLVDPEMNLTLKLGAENRYDSDPGAGFKRNDLDYFATLVWAF